MSTLNHLDAVWASLSTADRLVLLGHDRDVLDAADKARLAGVAAAQSPRGAAQTGQRPERRPEHRSGRRSRAGRRGKARSGGR